MANVKITDLTAIAATDLATNDVVPIVDINNNQTKKVQLDELREFVGYANDFVTFSQLNANINVVSGNVDAVEANVASIVDTGGHTITFSANGIPSADSTYDLGSASNKWKDLYLSGSSIKLGAITITELGGEGITITGTSGKQANITTPQLGGVANLSANAAELAAGIAGVTVGTAADTETRLNANLNVLDANADAIEARRVANVTIMTNEDTALQARLTTNVTTFTNEDTALQARLTANVTTFTNEDTALQARIAANTLVAASNDFVTFTRLNSNINVVQSNVANIIDGTTAFTGDVTLESTDGGSAAGPVIVLDRQSASPANADYLGRIQFKGKDDGGGNETYGQISGKIIDVAAGSEDGAIEFNLRKAGSSTIVARLRSDKLQLLNSTELSVDGASEFTGSVTMNDEVTMTDDLIITGNLTVNGTTTTINTTNMDVDDTMIMLANGTTGSPANDIGILFNRGAQGNAAFFYDESAKTFKLSDTKDPKSNTSLSPVSASNLDVGALSVATISLGGSDLAANLTALAAGIVTAGTSGVAKAFPSGDDLDFGTLTGANTGSDPFGVIIGDTYFFDNLTDPTGEVATEDLGALS